MHATIARADRRASFFGRMAVLCVVLIGANTGCAPTRRSPFVAQEDVTITVQIDNRAFQDATVHAVWPGRRLRLGTVTGATKANYTIQLDRSVLLRFELNLLAGPRCNTREIWADPGDIIVLEIDARFMSGPDCLR